MNRKIKKLLASCTAASLLSVSLAGVALADDNGGESLEAASANDAEIYTTSSGETVTLSFDGSSVDSTDGNTYTAQPDGNGNYCLELSGGSYILEGTAGNIYISLPEDAEADFSLNDLTVENEGVKSSFITADKSTSVDIILEGSSLVKGGAGFVSQKKKSELNISGSGAIAVESPEEDAIKTKGTLNILEGSITLTGCLEDGIQAEDLNISGGTLNIDTLYEYAARSFYSSGRYTDSSQDSVNYLWESGDTVKYERVNVDTGSHKGIKVGTKAKTYEFSDNGGTVEAESASGTLNISGGEINIDTRKSGIKANSVYSDGYSATSSGKYIIGSPDDAISCNNDIVISGGSFELYSSDDGISAMGSIDISGEASVNIHNAFEGMEGQSVSIGSSGSPEINIWSSDDGINTSGKTLTYIYDSYTGYETDEETGYTKKTVSTTTGNDLMIDGGTVNIYIDSEGRKETELPNGSLDVVKTVTYGSSGDGVDCNGALVQNGGELYVYGQSSGDNSPIDTNDGYSFNSGAKVLGTGTAGMEGSAPESGSGKYLTYGSGGNMQPGMPDNSNNNNNNFNNNNTNNNGTPPELPGNTAVSDNSSIDAGGNPPEMPDNSNSNGTPPELPDNSNSNGTPPELPDNSNSNGTPPELPDNSNNNGTPPEMPDNSNNNGNPPDSAQGSSFTAGQYWVVSDSEGNVVDSGKLEYAGSFIVYGSPLIENGTYTLSVSDTGDKPGSSGNETVAPVNPNEASGQTVSADNLVKGSFNIGSYNYDYSYTGTVSYNGKKVILSDFRINGQEAGSTLSGNIIFKRLRYKNNKKAGTAFVIPVFKAAGGSGVSVRKAVKEINKYFRTNPLEYTIAACELSNEMLCGSAVYKKSSGKWSFSLKADTGESKPVKLKYGRDFTVSEDSPDEAKETAVIKGCGNYTGEATVTGVTIK